MNKTLILQLAIALSSITPASEVYGQRYEDQEEQIKAKNDLVSANLKGKVRKVVERTENNHFGLKGKKEHYYNEVGTETKYIKYDLGDIKHDTVISEIIIFDKMGTPIKQEIFDDQGRVLEKNFLQYKFSYDNSGFLSEMYLKSLSGKLVLDSEIERHKYYYDDKHRITSIESSYKGRVIPIQKYSYNANGDTTYKLYYRHQNNERQAHKGLIEVESEFDENRKKINAVETIDDVKWKVSYRYDNHNKLIEKKARSLIFSDSLEFTDLYQYDKKGDLIEVDLQYNEKGSVSREIKETFINDKTGNWIKKIRKDGWFSEIETTRRQIYYYR